MKGGPTSYRVHYLTADRFHSGYVKLSYDRPPAEERIWADAQAELVARFGIGSHSITEVELAEEALNG